MNGVVHLFLLFYILYLQDLTSAYIESFVWLNLYCLVFYDLVTWQIIIREKLSRNTAFYNSKRWAAVSFFLFSEAIFICIACNHLKLSKNKMFFFLTATAYRVPEEEINFTPNPCYSNWLHWCCEVSWKTRGQRSRRSLEGGLSITYRYGPGFVGAYNERFVYQYNILVLAFFRGYKGCTCTLCSFTDYSLSYRLQLLYCCICSTVGIKQLLLTYTGVESGFHCKKTALRYVVITL